MGEDGSLPPLYATWMRQLLEGDIPHETRATCAQCAMAPPPGEPVGDRYFDPTVKCCSYQPDLPNFLIGHIIARTDADSQVGRVAIHDRLSKRVGVTPLGFHQLASYRSVYRAASQTFGRAASLRCPYYDTHADACGIWRDRPAVCATWFCKFNRGAVSARFWDQLHQLLATVESELSVWCAGELDVDAATVGVLVRPATLDPAEVGAPIDEQKYQHVWGRWASREVDYYRECAHRVAALHWDAVRAICGPRTRLQAIALAAAFAQLSDTSVPARLQARSISLHPEAPRKFLVNSYRATDPLSMSDTLMRTLPYFRGQPTHEALEEIRVDLGVVMHETLLRRMVDFGLLVAR